MKSLALSSKPQVFENCPVLGSRTALFFESSKFCCKTPKTSWKICEGLFLFSSIRDRLKKIFLTPFLPEKFFEEFFLTTLAPVFLVLGLEHSCSWPREGLSSEVLSLVLASDFFVFLVLATNLVPSTPPLVLRRPRLVVEFA